MKQNERLNNRFTDKERILVIGLDSCDVDLVERWSKEGRIPFLAFLGQLRDASTETILRHYCEKTSSFILHYEKK